MLLVFGCLGGGCSVAWVLCGFAIVFCVWGCLLPCVCFVVGCDLWFVLILFILICAGLVVCGCA